MAKYKGRNVQITGLKRDTFDEIYVTSKELGAETAKIGDMVFSPEEKSNLLKDHTQYYKDREYLFKTYDDVIKEREQVRLNEVQAEKDAYNRLTPDDKLIADKVAADKAARESRPVTLAVQPNLPNQSVKPVKPVAVPRQVDRQTAYTPTKI